MTKRKPKSEHKKDVGGYTLESASSILIRRLKMRDGGVIDQFISMVRGMRKNMSVLERCHYEVGLAMEYYHQIKNQIENWLFYTEDRLLEVLNGKTI